MKSRTLGMALGTLMLAAAMAGCATHNRRDKEAAPEMKASAENIASRCGEWLLLPAPRTIAFEKGMCAIGKPRVEMEGIDAEAAARIEMWILNALAARRDTDPHACTASLRVDPGAIAHPQGYALRIRPSGIEITGHDAAGVFYGVMTLWQLATQSARPGALPCVDIADWPDFPNRGVMLDISRDKVPEMETLYAIVDMMAKWKLNQLQLYTEHTFAYRDHHIVWENASPMTPGQIRQLDAYCKARYIELVPNQNSFGHMGRWLQFPEYEPFCETAGGGSDLCPVNPTSVEFLRGLYADLLPNFSSRQVNVGCDETWTLGKGRSAEAVREKGTGRVYLDFLLKIHDLTTAHGSRMQFWGDIIMQHPELVSELPKDIIALEWGYEADHPFAEHGKRFAASGIPYYVCPGTSTWLSLVGRTDNAVKNLRNAAENGLANGAIGYLITDWGDCGHWQYLPASYLGFAYGAGMSWCVDRNKDMNLPRALDEFAFQDAARVMGSFAHDLGNAYLRTGATVSNGTVFYTLLQLQPEEPLAKTPAKSITRETLQATIDYLDALSVKLSEAQMGRPDAALIVREYRQQIAVMKFACRLGQARVDAGGIATSKLPANVRRALAEELAPLIPEHRQLWLARNRCGGLRESADRFENLLRSLQAP
ncbi:MAG TPA: family 20 glycosylhydrolase [Candidatus Hydrogenedentes bacterium]|mgnify:CR=1 FL=1|nr:family 20 glycosylhydrolase [Candidatus Hydrogenedentota bacterium]HOS01615.1 family 20 glycosylhydrolase [Candidatus Hydrogenedentota bacterium]